MRRFVLLAGLALASSLSAAMPGTGRAASTMLLGNSAVASVPDNDAAGLAEAFRFGATASGKAGSVSVYVDGGSRATGLVAGVYTNNSGHPGSLLAYGSKLAPGAGQWNQVTLNTGLTITSGASYWLAVLGTGGQLNFRDVNSGGVCSETSRQSSLTSLPSSWTSGAGWSSCSLSAYLAGTTSGGPALSAPAATAVPAIKGQAVRGATLTSTTGSWSNAPTAYAYRWEDCNVSGAGCAAIGGATGSSHALASTDVGHTIRVVVTASNSAGSGSATSAQTATVSAPSSSCTTTLSPAALGSSPYPGAALESALRSASGGSTICLSSGTAGQIDIYNVSPSSNVTVAPAPGATVNLGNINVGANTHNVTFTRFSAIFGVAIGSSGSNCCSNLWFTYDAFRSGSYVRDVVNSNIVFAHDTFNNINVCSSCYEGRIEVVSSTVTQPDGVVIENSVMSGGNSDGVQDDGIGTQILDNEFSNIIESSCGAIHCDAIQTVGAIGTVIAGNYFHNVTDCFLMDNGGANITIRGNECGPMAADSSFWIQAGGIKGLTLSHNTITATTGGAFGNDFNASPTSNVTVTSNIEYSVPGVNPGQSLSGTTNESYNLVQSCGGGLCGGPHDIIGAPTFSGGRAPSTWAGFALASGSLGIANASDGLNRGVSSFAVTPGP